MNTNISTDTFDIAPHEQAFAEADALSWKDETKPARRKAAHDAFAAALAEHYLADLSDAQRLALAPVVFRKAWSDGHSYGLSAVETEFAELSEIALAAVRS